MAKETENKDLDASTVNEGAKLFLKSPEYGLYLIAKSKLNGERIACLMVTIE